MATKKHLPETFELSQGGSHLLNLPNTHSADHSSAADPRHRPDSGCLLQWPKSWRQGCWRCGCLSCLPPRLQLMPGLLLLLSLQNTQGSRCSRVPCQSEVMTSMATHPLQDLPLNREQHCKLLLEWLTSRPAEWPDGSRRGTQSTLGAWVGPACCWVSLHKVQSPNWNE